MTASTESLRFAKRGIVGLYLKRERCLIEAELKRSRIKFTRTRQCYWKMWPRFPSNNEEDSYFGRWEWIITRLKNSLYYGTVELEHLNLENSAREGSFPNQRTDFIGQYYAVGTDNTIVLMNRLESTRINCLSFNTL